MDQQGAINIAKGAGYGIIYSANPKGYIVIHRWSDDSTEEELFGSYDDCIERLAQIGYEVLESALGI